MSQPVSLCSLPLSGSGQEDELGHEEDVLPVEGPGAGGDQHCSPLQFPGSAGAWLPSLRAELNLSGPWGPRVKSTLTARSHLLGGSVRQWGEACLARHCQSWRGLFEKEMTHREAVTCHLWFFRLDMAGLSCVFLRDSDCHLTGTRMAP